MKMTPLSPLQRTRQALNLPDTRWIVLRKAANDNVTNDNNKA